MGTRGGEPCGWCRDTANPALLSCTPISAGTDEYQEIRCPQGKIVHSDNIFSARIAAPSEIRKGIGRFYPLLNEIIPGAGAPWTPLESIGALRAPRVGASRLLQLD